MMQMVNKPKYYYDKDYDSLTIFLDKSDNVSSEEVANNIYFVKDEFDDKLVSVEILYFMSRSIQNLKILLPDDIYKIVDEVRYKL